MALEAFSAAIHHGLDGAGIQSAILLKPCRPKGLSGGGTVAAGAAVLEYGAHLRLHLAHLPTLGKIPLLMLQTCCRQHHISVYPA